LSIDGELIDLQTESTKVIENLKKAQENAEQESLPIAEQQLGVLEGILSSIKAGAFQTTVNMMLSDEFGNYNRNLKETVSTMSELLAKETAKLDKIETLDEALGLLNTTLEKLNNWLISGRSLPTPTVPGAPPGSADGGIVSSPATVYVGEYMNAETNPEVIAPLDKLTNILAEVMPVKSNVDKIDVNLNGDLNNNTSQNNTLDLAGGFEVNLKLNERNLPPNINTEVIADALVKNPNFILAIGNAVNGKNKTYRGIA
jgi:hypothetical protein